MHKLLMVSCLSFGLLGAATLVAAQGDADPSRLEATLLDFQTRYGFPGATAAIALLDGTVITVAVGLADVESGRKMTPDTPMLAASIGKTFVAATILALESEGLLSRTDLLSSHLGDRAWFGDLPNAGAITLDHLLHHSAGLPDHVYLPAFQSAWPRLTGEGPFDPEELVGFLAGEAPLFQPGSGWAYSDTGYILLGLVIEKVTGQTYFEAVRARFLGPLGLTSTVPSDRRDLPGLAVGYVAPGNPFALPSRTADAEGRLLWNPAVEWTGGGYASTAPDLARWGQLLFSGQAMDATYLDRLLSGVAVSPDAPGIFYGTGVAIYEDTPRDRVLGHGGWIPGYVSSLRHYSRIRVTVAFQINTDVGVFDDSTDLVPALEAALADLAMDMAQ